MINPGVVTLASLNDIEYMNFPYRFCVEDNIGEAVHIHFKDMRLDLSTEQFRELSGQMEWLINGIVRAEGFRASDFDPVFLVGISSRLADLRRIEFRDLYLEDILVDTFDADGNAIYADIKHSRVFKALCGVSQENDRYKIQFNHFASGTSDKISNRDRLLWNLAQVKKNGYPADGNLITVTSDNIIQDGQHRAACLYYLYGNIRVPVRTLVFEKESRTEEIPVASDWVRMEKELWEEAEKDKQVFTAYFDDGNGFCQEKSSSVRYSPAEAENGLKINLPRECKRIRLDPAENACCVSLNKIQAIRADGSVFDVPLSSVSSNSVLSVGNEYCFTTDDPQLWFSDAIFDGVGGIMISFTYKSKDSVNEIMKIVMAEYHNQLNEKNKSMELLKDDFHNVLSEKSNLEKTLLDYQIKLSEKDRKLEVLTSELCKIKNSRSWKITTPLRFISNLAKPNEKKERN